MLLVCSWVCLRQCKRTYNFMCKHNYKSTSSALYGPGPACTGTYCVESNLPRPSLYLHSTLNLASLNWPCGPVERTYNFVDLIGQVARYMLQQPMGWRGRGHVRTLRQSSECVLLPFTHSGFKAHHFNNRLKHLQPCLRSVWTNSTLLFEPCDVMHLWLLLVMETTWRLLKRPTWISLHFICDIGLSRSREA